ncbi:phosphopyruvate hydratase [Candidatus Dependentiae bacterium]|nr:phosphopyruvate hydratase [Candidatus Dependentiae bacterium]
MKIKKNIKKIVAHEILDSRGNPTIDCTVVLESGQCGRANVPSGSSVGTHEAVELRDGDKGRFNGKGVLRAVEHIEKIIAPELTGKPADVCICDKIMLDLDGTVNKSKLGANAILGVSMAVVRAQAEAEGKALHQMIRELFDSSAGPVNCAPQAMFNVLNGGVHADTKMDFQEFMIIPVRQDRFSDMLHTAVLVYYELKKLLHNEGYSTSVGDEGGFAPCFDPAKKSRERQALDFLVRAVEGAGFSPGKDVLFSCDVAATHFYSKRDNKYIVSGEKLSAQDLINEYKELVKLYPICSIEDGLDEQDWDGWALLTKALGEKVMLVGDDIFVSNPERILRGVGEQIANAVLIKPNQIGTVTECLRAVSVCRANRYRTVVSHRSGETCDTFIADLAVGTSARFLKAGAPARGERVAKYNRLLEISSITSQI